MRSWEKEEEPCTTTGSNLLTLSYLSLPRPIVLIPCREERRKEEKKCFIENGLLCKIHYYCQRRNGEKLKKGSKLKYQLLISTSLSAAKINLPLTHTPLLRFTVVVGLSALVSRSTVILFQALLFSILVHSRSKCSYSFFFSSFCLHFIGACQGQTVNILVLFEPR